MFSRKQTKGNGNGNVKEYINLFSGVDKDQIAEAGISMWIKKNVYRDIRNIGSILRHGSLFEILMKVLIRSPGRHITIFGSYALNDVAIVQAKDDLNEALKNVVDNIPQSHEITITRNLNEDIP